MQIITVERLIFRSDYQQFNEGFVVTLNQFPSNVFFVRISIVSSNGTLVKRAVASWETDNNTLVSYDVTALFTNVPLEDVPIEILTHADTPLNTLMNIGTQL